jgi:hypothetical protein
MLFILVHMCQDFFNYVLKVPDISLDGGAASHIFGMKEVDLRRSLGPRPQSTVIDLPCGNTKLTGEFRLSRAS